MCAKKTKKMCDTTCIFAFSGCCHCFPRKVLLPLFLLPEDFFKTRAYSSSLAVLLIFGFRQNVELLLSTTGDEALVSRSCAGDDGIKSCCSKPRDEQLGNCFRKCYWQLIHCLVWWYLFHGYFLLPTAFWPF